MSGAATLAVQQLAKSFGGVHARWPAASYLR
jgi:hypothetical protein